MKLPINRVAISWFRDRRCQAEPFEQRTEQAVVTTIGVNLQRVDATHRAINHRDAFRRVEIKAVMIDALIADVWPNHYLCVRHRLMVARELQLNLRDISISKERHPFGSVQTRRIVVNDEIDLFRSGGNIDRRIAGLSAGARRSVVSIRESAIHRGVASSDLEWPKQLIRRDPWWRRGNQLELLRIVPGR